MARLVPRSHRWEPFREIERLFERMEQLFSELLPAPRRREEALEFTWTPAVDVYETEGAYVVEADLPGLKKDDLRVTVHDNVLTIQGERKYSREFKEENLHRQERFYGKFVRSFVLPDTVDAEKIEAEFKDGVLRITLPRKTKSEGKVIEIK